jgi:predicted lipoprotein with Yx(FWY)xxD motif
VRTMTTSRTHRASCTNRPAGLLAAAAIATLALVLAGCGSGKDDASAQPGAAASGRDVATGTTDLGSVLVDKSGDTMYAFAADSKGTSTCTGACVTNWPPVKAGTGTPSHTDGVTATLGTTKRSEGSTQLTVNGWPMYTYAGDDKPGQATGQGLDTYGGKWWVVDKAGDWVKKSAEPTDGGGGYGY